MGIQGLIPFLEKASAPSNVSQFAGKTVAVDAYCWLHKGAFSCADRLARGENCDNYVHYCMKFVIMLLSYRIKPILVFDGQKLPAKADTEKKRRENREINRKKAAELLRLDKSKEAQTYLRRCVDITHEMALQLIRACRARNVDCIVAPYEADAQLAFFNVNDIADVIITEDSDLLLFGAKKVLFKMDVQGNGLLVEQEKLHLAMDVRPENFSFDKFRYMCILSGCDYLPSLPGIGLVKARRFINRTADPDIHRAISRMGGHLNMPQLEITKEYRDNFMAADFMFKYQPVFDPFKRCIVPLLEFSDEICQQKFNELLAINGLSEDQICQLAYGNLDPFSLKKLDNWHPGQEISKPIPSVGWNTNANSVAPHPSIWSDNYEPKSWYTPVPKPEPPNAFIVSSSVKIVQNKAPAKTTPKRDPKELDEAVKQLKSLYQTEKPAEEEKRIDGRLSPSPKKTYHNPWKSTSTLPSANKRNTGALSKFISSCKASPTTNSSPSNKVISRYFFSAVSPTNQKHETPDHKESETEALQAMYSAPLSPNQSEPVPDSGSFCERSPLKDQNSDTSLCDNEKSPDLNKSVSRIRKRLNPFAVKGSDKKYCAKFPVSEDQAKKSSQSKFSWSDNMTTNTTYDFATKNNSIAREFKQPRKLLAEESENDENEINDQDDKLTPEQEDEGFCSPSVETPDKSPPPLQKKCRSPGLNKKSMLKQKSIAAMFAYKQPAKLKL
ncbi:exonuclease 1 isoform X2 [Planococcus citri]|uniref:exonuclease 1 isoform X2 n=1 Tax=Planococcus citri TaxID=170843 RepID=UPI0031F9FF8E